MAKRCGNNGNTDRHFLELQNHCGWWLQPWNWRRLLLGRKVMTNLDNILKSRDITLPTKVYLVKAVVFLGVMHGCESWTIKVSTEELMLLNCGIGEDSWVCWTARKSTLSVLKEINPEYSSEGLMLKLKLQYFGHLKQRADSLQKTLMLGKIQGRTDDRVQDGWLASPTQRTWVWASSGR